MAPVSSPSTRSEAALTDEIGIDGAAPSGREAVRPLQPGTLAEKVYGVFLQRIVTGLYALGQRRFCAGLQRHPARFYQRRPDGG